VEVAGALTLAGDWRGQTFGHGVFPVGIALLLLG